MNNKGRKTGLAIIILVLFSLLIYTSFIMGHEEGRKQGITRMLNYNECMKRETLLKEGESYCWDIYVIRGDAL